MIKDIFKTYSEHDIYTKSSVSKNQEHVETIKGFRVSEVLNICIKKNSIVNIDVHGQFKKYLLRGCWIQIKEER